MSINWPYVVEDNFLRRKDYKYLFQFRDMKIKEGDGTAVVKNGIWLDGSGRIEGQLSNDYMTEFHNDYYPKLHSFLEKLAPERIPKIKWLELNLVWTDKNYKYPIHVDSPNKLLSVVVYLYPKENSGTILYSDKGGSDKTFVNWVPNRALIFARQEGVTWHSYEGDGISQRYTLVINLRNDPPT